MDDFEYELEQQIQNRRNWLTGFFGSKCEDFEPDCLCCKMWKLQEEFEEIINTDLL